MTRMRLRLQRFLKGHRYRPEIHYMRGPGPKSLARTYARTESE